jgi:hypothetical protein
MQRSSCERWNAAAAASAADCASPRSVVARQEFFFAATAAACLVTIACEIYCDASFGEITVNMLATIIVGMGPAQTLGGFMLRRRSRQQPIHEV